MFASPWRTLEAAVPASSCPAATACRENKEGEQAGEGGEASGHVTSESCFQGNDAVFRFFPVHGKGGSDRVMRKAGAGEDSGDARHIFRAGRVAGKRADAAFAGKNEGCAQLGFARLLVIAQSRADGLFDRLGREALGGETRLHGPAGQAAARKTRRAGFCEGRVIDGPETHHFGGNGGGKWKAVPNGGFHFRNVLPVICGAASPARNPAFEHLSKTPLGAGKARHMREGGGAKGCGIGGRPDRAGRAGWGAGHDGWQSNMKRRFRVMSQGRKGGANA